MRFSSLALFALVFASAAQATAPVLVVPQPNPHPGSFLLKCRGGAAPIIGFEMNATAHTSLLFVRFNPSPKPANSGLNPGDCAWVDRGFRAGEPAQLCQSNVGSISFQAPHDHDTRFSPADIWLLSTRSDSAPWLEKAQRPDQFFDVWVQSDGHNCMNVTGF